MDPVARRGRDGKDVVQRAQVRPPELAETVHMTSPADPDWSRGLLRAVKLSGTQTEKLKSIFVFSLIFARFPGKLVPKTPPDGPGSKSGAECP